MENKSLFAMLKALLGKNFGNVYSKNEYFKLKKNTFYIYNTEMKPKFGHFVALYYNANQNLEIFDSLNYTTVPEYITKQTKIVNYVSNRKIQSKFSQLCGLYCLYWIYFRYLKYENKCILSHFSNNQDVNDSRIYLFYKKNFSFFRDYKLLTVINSKFILRKIKQICHT